MKNLSTVTCILATWAVAVIMSSAAQIAPSSQAPAAEEDCVDLVYGMIDCMGFLTVGGSETTPQGSCCSGLETLVGVNADCVCAAIDIAPTLGLDLDIDRARALPSRCGLPKPKFHTCNMFDYDGGESPSPANSANSPAPASAIGKPPTPALGTASAPTTVLGAAYAPAPAPSNSASVALPAIFFLLLPVFCFFLINA